MYTVLQYAGVRTLEGDFDLRVRELECAAPAPRAGVRLPHRAEASAELLDEELRLLEGGEVLRGQGGAGREQKPRQAGAGVLR